MLRKIRILLFEIFLGFLHVFCILFVRANDILLFNWYEFRSTIRRRTALKVLSRFNFERVLKRNRLQYFFYYQSHILIQQILLLLDIEMVFGVDIF